KIRGFIMKNKSVKITLRVTLIVIFMASLLYGVVYVVNLQSFSSIKSMLVEPFLTKKVKEYESTIEKYAKEHDVKNHVDTILAMMMQESGGREEDPMQSSESYCGEIGCIYNPEKSIDQGIKYFSESLEAANGDVRLAVQSYNFGKEFSNYVSEKETTFSQEITIAFSHEMVAKAD